MKTATIRHLDGSECQVRVLPIDLIRVERQGEFGKSETGFRLYHAAESRVGARHAGEDFDTWAETVADVIPAKDDTSLDPTPTAPSVEP